MVDNYSIYYPSPSMFSSLNPILKDNYLDFNQNTYVHGTYRMKFIRSKVPDEETLDNSAE